MADPLQYLMVNEQEMAPLGPLDRLMFQQPQGFGGRVQDVWNSPTPGSLFDLLKSAYTGVRGAGRAASGGYTTQPEVPGQWSETDEFRQQQARQTMQGDAGAAAGVAMMGAFPMAQRGALGMAGGRIPANQMSVKEVDSQLENLLRGTDFHIMDVAGRTPAQLQAIKDQLPRGAMELALARDAAIKAEERAISAVDKQLSKLLKGTDITPMDIAMRGPEGMEKVKHLIPQQSWDEVLALAQKRRQLEGD